MLVAPALAYAQAEELENPGTVSAIQERAFRMNHEFTLGVGTLPLDAFYKFYYAQVAYAFHITDTFAAQLRGAGGTSVNTGLREQLERDFGVLPTAFSEVQYFAGFDLMYSPFYGKVAVLNRSVLHFEGYFILGGSAFKVNDHVLPFPAVNFGVGMRLFHSKRFSYRLDVTDNLVIKTPTPFNIPTITLSACLNLGATE